MVFAKGKVGFIVSVASGFYHHVHSIDMILFISDFPKVLYYVTGDGDKETASLLDRICLNAYIG